jgi:hypothetical protein
MMRHQGSFIALCLMVAAARLVILLSSQTHVHSDEAIIGLMAKHIEEGRYFPFYMYGQDYNAGAAWEAYLAAIPFRLFGLGVIPLKSCIVVLSLLCLALFYSMCRLLYNRRTALFGSLVLALTPSLLKWHFQVRGYSWYFLSVPLLVVLFFSIQRRPRTGLFLFFGVVSGMSIWVLELAIAFNAVLWLLLVCSRNASLKKILLAFVGFLLGYSPAVAFNLTHQFANWKAVLEKTGGASSISLNPKALTQVFFVEMPKFFGPDTVLWYYPERPASGLIFYTIALLAIATALWPFIRSPSKIAAAIRAGFATSKEERDLLMLGLAFACFVPYLTAGFRVASYFLGGCFFFAALTGRLIERCFASSGTLIRFCGAAILAAVVITGTILMIDIAGHKEIETLTLCGRGDKYRMTRIPAADLEGIENHLRQRHLSDVWATLSFVYPLLFESGETLAVSDGLFGEHDVYPAKLWRRRPVNNVTAGFVIEYCSPFRGPIEAQFRERGVEPITRKCGELAFIEAKGQ